jgi:hypothetical protein
MTVFVDDFVVSEGDAWVTIGRVLLDAIREWGRDRGAVQTVVVCGPLDQPKRAMLEAANHVVASEWWTSPLTG